MNILKNAIPHRYLKVKNWHRIRAMLKDAEKRGIFEVYLFFVVNRRNADRLASQFQGEVFNWSAKVVDNGRGFVVVVNFDN